MTGEAVLLVRRKLMLATNSKEERRLILNVEQLLMLKSQNKAKLVDSESSIISVSDDNYMSDGTESDESNHYVLGYN